MPWSDWQDPLDTGRSAVATRVNADINVIGAHGFTQPTISNLGLSSVVFRDADGDTNGRADLLQFAYPADWETFRNWFPAQLQALEYGVDYGPRPDRNEATDDDAYIEYEAGPNVDLGWSMPSVEIQPLAVADDLSQPADGTGVGTLEVLATAYPSDAPGTDIGTMPVGAVIRTVSVGEGGTFTPDPPAFSSFSFVIATSGIDIPVNTHIGWGVTLSALPAQSIRSPRWRYWIPEGATPTRTWVRLLHRGDGLGMSVKRLRGGADTHQAGRLRASY